MRVMYHLELIHASSATLGYLELTRLVLSIVDLHQVYFFCAAVLQLMWFFSLLLYPLRVSTATVKLLVKDSLLANLRMFIVVAVMTKSPSVHPVSGFCSTSSLIFLECSQAL